MHMHFTIAVLLGWALPFQAWYPHPLVVEVVAIAVALAGVVVAVAVVLVVWP